MPPPTVPQGAPLERPLMDPEHQTFPGAQTPNAPIRRDRLILPHGLR